VAADDAVERSAPLCAVERQFWGDALSYFAATALHCDLPAADRAVWEDLTDTAGRERLFADADFSSREGHVVAVGTVPHSRL
jgi:hypothetical protein